MDLAHQVLHNIPLTYLNRSKTVLLGGTVSPQRCCMSWTNSSGTGVMAATVAKYAVVKVSGSAVAELRPPLATMNNK